MREWGNNLVITVKLHTSLKSYSPDGGGYLEVAHEEGLTVKRVLEKLGLNNGVVGLTLVNGLYARMDYKLKEGDSIEFYPIFGGG